MTDKEKKLLAAMMADMDSAPSLYQPTRFWRKGVEEIIEDLETKGVDCFKSHMSALRFYVPTFGYPGFHDDPDKYKKVCDALDEATGGAAKLDVRLRHLLSGKLPAFAEYRTYLASRTDGPPNTDHASESEIGEPIELFEFDGRRFSRASLNYLLGINFLKKTCAPKEIRTVMEIGGGFGALGETLLSDPESECFYIDVDIPPTGFVATRYLQKVYGDDRVADYVALKDRGELSIEQLRNEFDAAMLCPWQLPKLTGTIDLFVNYISFQEMEPEVVENYLEQVRRLSPTYILLRNLREGKQEAKSETDIAVRKATKGGDYDAFLPNYDFVAANTVPFGHLTEDGFHSELRLYERTS